MTGGAAALLGAWYVGPRIGRFDKGTKAAPLKDPLLSCIGMLILWWGWFGFNAGSSYGITEGKMNLAARAGAGTLLASIGAGVTSFTFSIVKNKGKVNVADVLFSIMGSLGELIDFSIKFLLDGDRSADSTFADCLRR